MSWRQLKMVNLDRRNMVDDWQFPSDSVCPPAEPDDDDEEMACREIFNAARSQGFLVPWHSLVREQGVRALLPNITRFLRRFLQFSFLLADRGKVGCSGQLCHDGDLSIVTSLMGLAGFWTFTASPSNISLFRSYI